MERIRVGVVGCGLIAQLMHLPHLRQLSDRFEIVALCDLSASVVHEVGEDFGVARRFTDADALLQEKLDAVLVLTSGNHAPVAIAAAASGRHVFVEKPLCLRVTDGAELLDTAGRAGVHVMTGYMKRLDPAFLRLGSELDRLEDIRMVTFTTLESPEAPYFSHQRIRRTPPGEPEVREELAVIQKSDDRLVADAIRADDPALVRSYRRMILDSMVHDLNLVRAVLGEPERVEFADIRSDGVTTVLGFHDAQALLTWIDLPGIAAYRQELQILAPTRRAKLIFPSPYLRNVPTQLVLEGGNVGTSHSWVTVETISYEEAFKQELLEFHAAIEEGREPVLSGLDGLRDVALAEAIVASHLDRQPRERPTKVVSKS